MRALLSAAVLIAVAVARPHSASADGAIIESRSDARAESADALLGPVVAVLAKNGFAAPGDVVERVHAEHSRPGTILPDSERENAKKFIDSGYEQFVAGQFKLAVRDIDRGLTVYPSAPGTLTVHQADRDVMLKALISKSLAHKRLGNAVEATAAMAELLRSFPDAEVSYKEYGPEPQEFFNKVKAELVAQGTSSLTVEVDDARTVVFVNERYAGVGKVKLTDLVPGRYRVFLKQGELGGRVHEIDVGGGHKTLSIQWGLDAILQTGDSAVLVFESETQRRELEGPHAVRIARAINAGSVAVLGVREVGGRSAVIGTIYSVESTKPIRSASVSVDPVAPSADKLRALGRFLSGDDDAARLVDSAVGSGATSSGDNSDSSHSHVLGWLTTGVGVGAIATGVTLIVIHKDEDAGGMLNSFSRNTRPAGIITAAAGAVVTGLGVYLLVRGGGESKQDELAVSAAPTANGFALSIAGRF
jgi:hypothetical protein